MTRHTGALRRPPPRRLLVDALANLRAFDTRDADVVEREIRRLRHEVARYRKAARHLAQDQHADAVLALLHQLSRET
ncbi:hypothetical protein [Nakamurella leprariae]|uniref:Uncharacterized protein n=1 Tax=Nakamurella leprariae TaxID=2803911 RepID=A0A938YCS4_9ACTN|nr:hypothetical protein [Nakamurella leprariae]MBM9466087.1 hypothetical protein [Nakamurella leprariae]